MASSVDTKVPTAQSSASIASATKEAQSRVMGISAMSQKEVNAFHSLFNLSDPVAVGYKIFFNFSTNYGLFGQETQDHKSNSAIDYLYRIGEDVRAALLKKFILLLQNINMNMFFMFQTIEGLDTIREHKPWEMFNPEESVITLGLLETIDFKTQALMSMYDSIWYDRVRGVEVLPANLRRFGCSIFIYAQGAYQIHNGTQETYTDEAGNTTTYTRNSASQQIDEIAIQSIPNILKSYSNGQAESASLDNTNNLYVKAPDLYNHVVYELSECEWIPWKSQDGFHKANNNETEFISTNSIAFSFRWCKPGYRFYEFLGDVKVSDVFLFQIATASSSAEAQSIIDKYNTWKSNAFSSGIFGEDGFLSDYGSMVEGMFDKAVAPLTSKVSSLVDKYGSVDKLKQAGTQLLTQAAQTVGNKLADTIAGGLNSLFLGNVYDWTSVSGLVGALTSDNMFGALTGELTGKSAASLKSSKKLSSPGPNVYSKM